MTAPMRSRREFLALSASAGAGLWLAFAMPNSLEALAGAAAPREFKPNAFLHLASDGALTVIVPKSEMGQGVSTSLPMILAEELDADWSRVGFVFAPAAAAYIDPGFGMQGTGGSSSVRGQYATLRQAGAAAREMLVGAAAARWKVAPAACKTENGFVLSGKRKLGYGALAADAARRVAPKKPALKDAATFRLIGKPTARLDIPAKVAGSARFGIDVRQPGQLFARVLRIPAFAGGVKSSDAQFAGTVPGVKAVVPVSGGIAVIATGTWSAMKGIEALKTEFSPGPGGGRDSAAISTQLRGLASGSATLVEAKGDSLQILTGARWKVESEYEAPFLNHATMEPMNATALVEKGRCTVWAPTQAQTMAQANAARICGLKPEQVEVVTTFLGGGFGRRFEMDFITDAVEAAKAVPGSPVQVVWSREDDMRHGFYRPASCLRIAAALDEDGSPLALSARIASPSIMSRVFPQFVKNGIDPTAVEGISESPYGFPAVRVEYARAETGVPVGFWRSVGHSINGWAMESFMDELATEAKRDPLKYRLSLLGGSPRLAGVLKLVAEKSGWGKPLPAGRARGIAGHFSFNSYAAEVVEVSLNPDGTPRVHKVTAALDCGRIVNPLNLKMQLESAVVYGLTAALYGEITIKDGATVQSNFHDYPLLRHHECPEIDAHLVDSREAPTGAGEPGVPPLAPALCNALFALTGRRIRRLPIRPGDLKA